MSRNRFLLSMRVAAVACVALAALVLLPQVSTIFAASYAPCKLPVVVGSTVKPNVLIIQDMSGSMQGAAYYDSYLYSYYNSTNRGYPSVAISPLSGVDAYQMNRGYYGSADTDVYYKYNATGNSNGGYFEVVTGATAPAQRVQFTEPSQQGATTSQITFTATGHGLMVGDWVAFYNLSSHLGMNGDAYQVVSVSGDSFTVNAQWNGTGDSIAGQAIKRIVNGTDVRNAVNGTVLNWLLTCRTDAAMKAFIGGRSVDYDGVYYYLQYQGMRRYVADETLGCLAHIRPATTSTADNSPTDYSGFTSGTYYGEPGNSTDPPKDMYMTLSNFWKGTLNSGNPNSKKGGSGHKAQIYSFTLTSTKTVTFRVFPADPAHDDWQTRIYLYNGATPSTTNYANLTDDGTTSATNQDGCAVISKQLGSGTYSIEVTSSGTNVYKSYYLAATFEEGNGVSRGGDPNVTLTKYTADAYHNGSLFTSTVGSVLNAQCRIQQPKANRAGVVQNSFKQVRFGFMYFNTASGNVGKILVGCENTDLDTLINAISGNGSQMVGSVPVDFSNCYPYNGTPTGEAMNMAYNYFTQTSTNSAWNSTSNAAFYPKAGSVQDPYYGYDPNNKLIQIVCRKSYVLLVSDGEWNGIDSSHKVDPVKPAREMHINDLRPGTGAPLGVPNPKTPTATGYVETPQTVTTYSIFTFSNSLLGTNALKFVAMYGGFTDISGCGTATWPYPMTGYPSPDSTLGTSTQFWDAVTKCDPRKTGDPVDPLPTGHSYNETCCKEWDNVVTREGEPADSNKGIPDNYFEASDGQALERSLKKVLQQVLARDASASAVATVSQQLATGDTVIRGVFEAQDQQNPDKFLWYGHLEAYWPFYYTDPDTNESGFKYEFELPYNSKLRCETMPGVGASYAKPHCWDAGLMLKDRDISSAGKPRSIFTAVYGTVAPNIGWQNLPFDTTNITAAMLGLSGTSAETDRQNLINWTLGNAIATLRLRGETVTSKQYKLGDIVYSTPVIGGPPSPGAVSSNDPNINDFWNYRNRDELGACLDEPDGSLAPRRCSNDDGTQREILYRDKFIFVGGNDGMVHAFLMAKWDPVAKQWIDQPHDSVDPDTTHGETDRRDANYDPSQIGREIWAYIPSNLLKGLQNLADPTYGTTASGGCSHRSMVDLSNQIFEVFIHDPERSSSTPREWRSVLVGGERGGGDTYFAIDVTDPYKPRVLWEYSVIKDRVVMYASRPYQPFEVAYDSMSNFPMSWTQPTPGRLQLPDVPFYLGPPDSTGLPTDPHSFGTTSPPDDDLKRRHVAFVGGGLHLFDKSFATSPDPPTGYSADLWNYFKAELYKPSLIVIDMETGKNLFKYIWPKVVDVGNATSPQVFPEITRPGNGNIIPYAMSDPVAVDVWDPATNSPSDDGFTDRVYMGDMTGLFYGVKFTPAAASKPGIEVDIWTTKAITDTTQQNSNYYRGLRQPISQSPSITFEPAQIAQPPYLRCIFATGKYEDVVGANDDKTDKHKTSLYNLRDAAASPTLTAGATNVFNTNFFVQLVQNCTSATFNTGCTWTKSDGTPDCCQGSCTSPCYQCVYDLTLPTTTTVDSAERFVAKPLTAGGYVFATSFLPTIDPCGYQGFGYLYIFPYLCTPLTENITIIGNTDVFTVSTLVAGGGGSSQNIGVQVTLGAGVPSKPVLDSSGKNVIVQMSDGTLLRIPVSLAMKPVQIQGWQEK